MALAATYGPYPFLCNARCEDSMNTAPDAPSSRWSLHDAFSAHAYRSGKHIWLLANRFGLELPPFFPCASVSLPAIASAME